MYCVGEVPAGNSLSALGSKCGLYTTYNHLDTTDHPLSSHLYATYDPFGQSEGGTDYTSPWVRGWKGVTCDIRVVVVVVVVVVFVVALGPTSMEMGFPINSLTC